MAKKNIFIGSATEVKGAAAKIAGALADAGYRPLRWWEEFPAGSITLDRLRQIANSEADGAVFLLTKVDKTWYRETSTETPRDNVVLEFGLFLNALDLNRTLILSDGARLPSDINGITFEHMIEDISTVGERVVNHFNRVFMDPSLPLQEITLVADPIVVQQQITDPLPDDWRQRNCYYGAEGAKAWLNVLRDKNNIYAPAVNERELRRLLLQAVGKIDVRTFVSFGPGDASADEELAVRLRNREPWLNYVPIDISDGLLQRAASLLREQVRVPIGILSDFEGRLSFITRQLSVHATPPMLLALLGNTLGNLDKFEESFLRNVRSMMQKGDHLLLDVSLAGPKWEQSLDRRGQHAGYGPGYRRFIANGVARRLDGISVDSIVADFTNRIDFPPGQSDVPKARTIDIVYRQPQSDEVRRVFTIRRYDWEALLDWLKTTLDFDIVYAEPTFIDDVLGDGVILLKLKAN